MENSLTVIIPAFNEEKSLKLFLPEVIQYCKENDFKLIIVNDGSTDQSKEIINSYAYKEDGFVLIHNKVNKGYGGAIKSAIEKTTTKYLITIDADGQHLLEDIKILYNEIIQKDADMVVGSRKGQQTGSLYRKCGKSIIRGIAKWLLPIHIYDINSGMKIYNTTLAQKYMHICPDSMAYSDVILFAFISQKHLVTEVPIRIKSRIYGKSTISYKTAFSTVGEIMNIVVLFNPMKIFLPISFISFVLGLSWGIPIAMQGKGVSSGAFLAIITGIIFFLLGLIAEQLSMIRKSNIK